MANRVSISDEYLTLDYIVDYKNELDKAIVYYFRHNVDFSVLTTSEMVIRKKERLKELETNVIFMLLSSIEAWVRLDYEYRVQKRLKDNLSKALKKEDQNIDKTYKISIEKLCDIYKKYTTSSLFSELKSAYKLRHWIAHGRYWNPKLARKYDFYYMYQLASSTYNFLGKV